MESGICSGTAGVVASSGEVRARWLIASAMGDGV